VVGLECSGFGLRVTYWCLVLGDFLVPACRVARAVEAAVLFKPRRTCCCCTCSSSVSTVGGLSLTALRLTRQMCIVFIKLWC
jgi:hypothetical protein